MSTYLDPRVGMSLGHALEGSPRSRSHVTRPRARSPVTRPHARSPSSELRTAGSATWPELMPPRGPSAPCPSASATNKGTLPLAVRERPRPALVGFVTDPTSSLGRVRYRPYSKNWGLNADNGLYKCGPVLERFQSGWRRLRGWSLSAPLGALRGSEGRRADPPRAGGGGPLGSEGTL